jgi:hypothetical protein
MVSYLELIEENPAGVNGLGEGYVVDDQSWLGSSHGTDTAESVMLDGATCLARFPDGVVPSGTCLGKITATGKYGPYAASGQTPVNEVQTVRVTNADRGTFSLNFRDEWTAPLAFGASAAQIVAALEALPSIGTGNVTGTGGPVNTANVTLTFAGDLAGDDVPQLGFDGSLLGNQTSEVQALAVANATGGTFTLVFRGQETAAIAYNATATAVRTALEGLANINPGDVTTGGGPLGTSTVTITFAGQYAQFNEPQLYANSSLVGTGAAATITTTTEGGQAAYPTPTVAVATTTPGAPPGGTGGLETFVGHLFTTRSVMPKGATQATDTSGALFWHGKVVVSKLPPNSGYTDAVAAAAKFIRYV